MKALDGHERCSLHSAQHPEIPARNASQRNNLSGRVAPGRGEESVISSPKSFEHSGLRTSLVQPQVLVKLRGQAGATEAAVRSQRDRAERLHRLGVLVRVEPDMGLL